MRWLKEGVRMIIKSADKIKPFKKLLSNVYLNANRPSPTRLSSTPDYKEKSVNLDAHYLMDLFYDCQKEKC